MNKYLFKIAVYDEYRDKEIINYGIVVAADYSAAVDRVVGNFTVVDSIEISELYDEGSSDILWLNHANYEHLKKNADFLSEDCFPKVEIEKCGFDAREIPETDEEDLWFEENLKRGE